MKPQRRKHPRKEHRRQESLALLDLERILTQELSTDPILKDLEEIKGGMKTKNFGLQKTTTPPPPTLQRREATATAKPEQLEIEEEVEFKLRLQTVMEGE